jgi:hypothetical protein
MNKRAGAALCALLLGCAAHGARPTQAATVDLELITAAGERVALHQLRGRPLLLFVFTTFDNASQLALAPLQQLALRHPELRVVGIAVQPQPDKLLPLYQESLDIEFELTYEPHNRVLSGDTPLGPVETVPSFVLLDADGHVAARRTGAATPAQLEELLAALP